MEGQIKGSYKILKKIGQGGMGSVFLACNKNEPSNILEVNPPDQYPKCYVALKKLEYENIPRNIPNANELVELLKNREIQNSESLQCENIVKVYGNLMDEENQVWIIQEYVSGGTLTNFVLNSENRKLNEAQAQQLFKDLCSGLKYLADKHIIHRDIKPENLLITKQAEVYRLKIADFGLSKNLAKKSSKMSTKCGTRNFSAPEVFSKQYKQSFKVDI